MKLSKYDRRAKLKAKGIRLLPSSQISRATSDKGQTQYWFDSEKALRAYASTVCIAEKGERLWNHHGWFTSEFQDETIKPVVAIIGQGAFYGYCESCSGCIVLIYDGRKETDDCQSCYRGTESREAQLRDLASSADCMAERAAEKEREHNERWQQARHLENEIDERQTTRQIHFENARQFVAEMREQKKSAKQFRDPEKHFSEYFPKFITRALLEIRHNRAKAWEIAQELRDLKTKLSTEFKDVL